MNTTTSPLTTPPVVEAATDLLTVLFIAQERGYPFPFAATANDTGAPVVLHVRTADDLLDWMEALNVLVDDTTAAGLGYATEGVLHGIGVRVVLSARTVA